MTDPMLEFVDSIYISHMKGLFEWPKEKKDLFLLDFDV